jgi:hypothetical protein
MEMYNVPLHSDSQEFIFTFTNSGDEPVAVASVNVSCGCISSLFTEGHILPGEKGDVIITLDPKKIGMAPFQSKAYVDFAADTLPIFELTVSGTVTSPITFEPSSIRITHENSWEPQAQTITIRNTTSTPLRNLDVKSIQGYFDVSPRQVDISAKGTTSVRVVANERAPTSHFSDKIIFESPSSSAVKFSVDVSGWRQNGPLYTASEVLEFGVLKSDSIRTRRLTIIVPKTLRADDVQIGEIEAQGIPLEVGDILRSESSNFIIELTPDASQLRSGSHEGIIRLEYTVGTRKGDLSLPVSLYISPGLLTSDNGLEPSSQSAITLSKTHASDLSNTIRTLARHKGWAVVSESGNSVTEANMVQLKLDIALDDGDGNIIIFRAIMNATDEVYIDGALHVSENSSSEYTDAQLIEMLSEALNS